MIVIQLAYLVKTKVDGYRRRLRTKRAENKVTFDPAVPNQTVQETEGKAPLTDCSGAWQDDEDMALETLVKELEGGVQDVVAEREVLREAREPARE